MSKTRIAIQNIHKLPNLATWEIHNYAIELIKRGHVEYVYLDEVNIFSNLKNKISLLNSLRKKYKWDELGLKNVKFLFPGTDLNKHIDVLLNFNSAQATEFTKSVKKFEGLKIFHLMDYFWAEPGSEKYRRLRENNVDYVMNYGHPDMHCEYFKKTFPYYVGRSIPVPFGYAKRFKSDTIFENRKNKCVALGSVNPLKPEDANEKNYIETAKFFNREKWFHKFRRMIVENIDVLEDDVDSMLPIYPQYKDFKYDIVKKLNEYKIFTCCESLFNFPPAKTYEGPACGTVMVCSSDDCYKKFGFQHETNCIMYKKNNIEDFKKQISILRNEDRRLKEISKRASDFIAENYSHAAIADNLKKIVERIWELNKNAIIDSADLRQMSFWPKYEERTL